jgi:tRNA(Arg) A34 adenosine deaminase TadA
MCEHNRRSMIVALVALASTTRDAWATASEHRDFIAAAFKMREEAITRGDQPYGAVVVRHNRIVGYAPSRVVVKNDTSAHAEREALRHAQEQLGSADLSDCLLYSSSRPCAACERAAAEAKIARMIYGAQATDAGRPR